MDSLSNTRQITYMDIWARDDLRWELLYKDVLFHFDERLPEHAWVRKIYDFRKIIYNVQAVEASDSLKINFTRLFDFRDVEFEGWTDKI